MGNDFKKDFIIGWEVIHLSKRGRKVTIRLKEFPTNPNRFLRVTFLRCSIAVIIDFNAGQIEDFTHFNSRACTIGNVKLGSDDLISIFLYHNDEQGGILKISCVEISHEFTSR